MSTSKRFLAKNGVDNNNNTITNVADPSGAQDVATKNFSSNASNLTSGTIPSGRLPSITQLANGTSNVNIASANGDITLTRAGSLLLTLGASSLDLANNLNVSNNGATILLNTTNTSAATLNLQVSGTHYGFFGIPATASGIITGSAVGDMCLRTASKAIRMSVDAGASAALTINSSANILIGSSADDGTGAKLQVTGGLRLTGAHTPAGASSIAIWSFEDPNTRFYIGDGTGYSLRFSSRVSNTTTDRVVFKDNGNVLIGTTTDNGEKLFVSGTALISSNVGIGASSNAAVNLQINKQITGAAVAYGLTVSGATQSGVTNNSISIYAGGSTVASSFTCANTYGLYLDTFSLGAGSAVTNNNGIFINTQTIGTNIYGIRSLIASGTNRWNLYLEGTAINHMAGALLIGTTTDNGNDKLQVSGSISSVSNSPSISNYESDAAVDEKMYRIASYSGVLQFELVNDARSNSYRFLEVDRTGINIDRVSFLTGANAEVARFTSGQRMLIGTTTDDGSNKLQVNGSAKISGQVEATYSFIKSGTTNGFPGFFQTGTILAGTGTAYGMLSRGTLQASSNSDFLVGISCDSGTLASGTFTGLTFAAISASGASWTKTGTGTVSIAYGLFASAPTLGTTNYAAYFQGLTVCSTSLLVGTTTDYGNNVKLQINGGVRVMGAASFGAAAASGVHSFEDPIYRLYVGDGTGYDFRFSKRASSTTTDMVTLKDSTGNLLINTTTDNGNDKLQVSGSATVSSNMGIGKAPVAGVQLALGTSFSEAVNIATTNANGSYMTIGRSGGASVLIGHYKATSGGGTTINQDALLLRSTNGVGFAPSSSAVTWFLNTANHLLPMNDAVYAIGGASNRLSEIWTGNVRFAGSITVTTGSGSPEGVLAAPVGSLYLRSDGGAGTTLYVKQSGTGNTGWAAK